VLDSFDQVTEAAERLGLSDALSLFARPSVTRDNGVNPGNIVWYGVSPGLIAPLGSADPRARDAILADIARTIGRLRPLMEDPRVGPLFAAWLNIPSLDDDVLLVNGRPVITNWGLLPAEVAAAPAAHRTHFERGLGRVLPGFVALPPSVTDAPAAAARPPASPGPPAAQAPPPIPQAAPAHVETASATPQPVPAVVLQAAGEPPARPWLPVALATAIAALLLLILVLPGVLRYPSDLPAARAVDPSVVAQTRQMLERRLDILQTMLRQGTCVSESDPRAPGQASARPLGPQMPGQPATQPVIPPSPERIAAPPPAGGGPTGTGNLISHLDRVTALIVAPKTGSDSVSFGTGFFIDGRHLVTNRHVVQDGDPSHVLVVNKAFGHVIEGKVVVTSGSSEIGDNDFAVVEITGAQGTPITLTNTVTRGDSVVAAGFPGAVMRSDQMFKHLMEGDFSSLPDPVVTQGWVTATQTSEHGLPVLVHGATISKGNSGGPLTDLCGRVVGVNTYGTVEPENALRLNFALRTDGLRKFLDERHIAYSSNDAACQPAAMPPATAAAAPPAPAPGTPAPGTPAPGTPAPGTPAPGTPAPGTPAPGTPAPGTPAPGAAAPGTPAPGTAAPGAAAPGAAAPGAAAPGAAAPGAAGPGGAANARPGAAASQPAPAGPGAPAGSPPGGTAGTPPPAAATPGPATPGPAAPAGTGPGGAADARPGETPAPVQR
jgi:S1-C subfamily serine protease